MKLNYVYADSERVLTNVKYDRDYSGFEWNTHYNEDGNYWSLVYIKDGEKYSMEIVDQTVSRDNIYFGFKCDNYVTQYPLVYLFHRDFVNEELTP